MVTIWPAAMVNLTDSEVLEICSIPEDLLRFVERSEFKSQTSFNHRRGLKVAAFLREYFSFERFSGKKIIELGPGHYSFSLIARHLGAEVTCIERDPDFAELGRALGFEVLEEDFVQGLPSTIPEASVDGIWGKGIFNAYVYSEEISSSFISSITTKLSQDGWGLIVTVNKGEDTERLHSNIRMQGAQFASNGWKKLSLREETARKFAMHYANVEQYTIGI